MSIKISKIIYFSSTFKLNERKKVPFKNGLERIVYKKSFAMGRLIFNRGWKIFQKRGSLTKRCKN